MKLVIPILLTLIASGAQADMLDDMMNASNWNHAERYPKTCTTSFLQGMHVIERKSPTNVKVSSNQSGFSPIAYIELNYSSGKEDLPVYGDGAVLDIFIERKKKTVDGYDHWVECTPLAKVRKTK